VFLNIHKRTKTF